MTQSVNYLLVSTVISFMFGETTRYNMCVCVFPERSKKMCIRDSCIIMKAAALIGLSARVRVRVMFGFLQFSQAKSKHVRPIRILLGFF